ncbi:SNARE complex subunit [Metarhizium guizhouense ARSEF 977]|uniref:SNARE complex subunit n=1 Tax=Metarhizium guizhouense (strain ARSEF 977) TaxID=1276136 RepID=A0A0B4H0Z5_METGA|nr:SNARE complex subunit [Metarhizium guizhouense ARSEF 977]
MTKLSQLFLLADHIKLSLLERQRATSLNLDSDSQDGHISRSLDQFRSGLASLEQEQSQHEQERDTESTNSLATLRRQLEDLTAQFHGFTSASIEHTLTVPNSNELAEDFSHASSRRAKTVRFSDSPLAPTEEPLGPYRDDPAIDSAGYRDQAAEMTNKQLHQYHSQILDEQDEQLDRLGESIGRQRDISIQIGDELDSHVAILDEMDTTVDRYQGRLDRAKGALGKVAKGAGENKQMTAIVVLIIILILLIAILK